MATVFNSNDGTGLVIAFDGSDHNDWEGAAADLKSLSWSGIERGVADAAHMGLTAPSAPAFGNRPFLAGALSDPGEITMVFNFNGDFEPPTQVAAATLTVNFPNRTGTTAAKWEASVSCVGYEMAAGLEETMEATLTFKVLGDVVSTIGAT